MDGRDELMPISIVGKPQSMVDVLIELRARTHAARIEAAEHPEQDSQEAAALRGKATGYRLAADLLSAYMHKGT